MKILLRLAFRYLISSKGSTLIVSLIAFFGVALSVLALLLTMGVFAGFQKALKEKILSSSPHLIVSLIGEVKGSELYERLKRIEGVRKVYFLIAYQGLVSREGRVMSVSVRATDNRSSTELYGKSPVEGLLIGKGLADILGVKEGDEIMLVSPTGLRTAFGFMPRVRLYKVEGVFQKGVFDQDYATVVMPVEQAKEFFGDAYQLYGFEVYLKDPYEANEVKVKVERLLGDIAIVRSWIDLNKPLFNALQLEKVGIFFVLLLMVVIASFNITALLFMKAREKVKDIAILRTFGLRQRQVFTLFLLQGFMMGASGTVLGLLLSLTGGELINRYKLVRVPAEVYLMDHVPVHFETSDIVFTLFGALLLSTLASLLPAYRASREDIVRVLRNE